ncbi:photosystem reaction center subunit H [Halobacteriales archaeon SW_7_68_16]|nr:MAG: photosystem reaction center subunit H [Halobacteriales archaeon SW_7_68_16]
MSAILAGNLSGKAVMGADGMELGTLYNVTMDLKTGELHDLEVTPNDEIDARTVDIEVDESGRFRIPVESVDAVRDYIVVDW